MVKVITYGTYDLLHYGHIRLLERAKALGDYLIVGVTADDFDKERGKINVQQSLMERVEAVRATGLANEIIIEEYEGQKIEDIQRYEIDIFTVGSDWVGKFDYLREYCKVVYLERTEGVSSSDIRATKRAIRLGLVGDSLFLEKVLNETKMVNGITASGVYGRGISIDEKKDECTKQSNRFEEVLEISDAIYIRSDPIYHYEQIKRALYAGKHVLCESPMTLDRKQGEELLDLARDKGLVLMEAIKTAYAMAYARLLLLVKAGKIGDIVSIDATCTSLRYFDGIERTDWNGDYEWGPTALLPIFQILGTDYIKRMIVSRCDPQTKNNIFTRVDFIFDHAVASAKFGDGIKSEGELIITGTKGYIYVPAPWWKTDYFEIRNERIAENKRYFYQLDGEGIRYELVAFARAIEGRKTNSSISPDDTLAICEVMGELKNSNHVIRI